jgi:acyl carrier protein
VLSQLQRTSHLPVDDEAVFSELRDIICEQTGLEPDKIVRDAYFVRDLRLD